MERKFRHKKCNFIAMEDTSERTLSWEKNLPKLYTVNFGGVVKNSLPAAMIEDSNDWEEIKEEPVIFTTHDNVPIRIKDSYYFIDKDYADASIHKVTQNNIIAPTDSKRLRFSKLENVQNYILENKPLFSIKDLEEHNIIHKTQWPYERMLAVAKQKLGYDK